MSSILLSAGGSMRVLTGIVIFTFLVVLSNAPVCAHHAFSAQFDAEKPVKLSGAVTRVEWENPHAWFYIDVKDASGRVENWGLEMGSPNILIRAGWGRNTLKPGDI